MSAVDRWLDTDRPDRAEVVEEDRVGDEPAEVAVLRHDALVAYCLGVLDPRPPDAPAGVRAS
jgi:hypothetical protein